MKRIASIQDISCLGRCSLTVALPVISALGVECAIVPTAVLSAHTAFPGFVSRDLTDQLDAIAAHWQAQRVHFDALYTGYIASVPQVQQVLDFFDAVKSPDTMIFVDPAMADHGKLYSGFDEAYVEKMKGLCAQADFVLPNLTEAAFLLDEPYPGKHVTREAVCGLCRGLRALGPENVVITDVAFGPGQTGVALLAPGMAEPAFLFRPRFDDVFYGTGDVFASLLLGALMNGHPLEAAVGIALDITHESIRVTLNGGEPLRYGVQFEKVLPQYWARLQEHAQQ